MHVIVIGAGVIGATTAYYLARDGCRVTVLERCEGPGLETSFANGGLICPSHAEPWASPEVPARLLKWLGRKDAPLVLRLRADPRQWAWALRFLANCRTSRFHRNTLRSLRLALFSRDELDRLRESLILDIDHRQAGILSLLRSERARDNAARWAEFLGAHGEELRLVDRDGALAIEPALADIADQLAGALYATDDESGDAYRFTCQIAAHAISLGADFRYATDVRGIVTAGGRITGVATADGTLPADTVVVAAGSYSAALLRPLGIRLPVYPAKGYSVTLPVTDAAHAPTVPVIDEQLKIVVTRLGDRLRAAGTAEIGGYDRTLNPHRADSMLRGLRTLFPRAGDATRAEAWCGLRPMTPDGPPVLGATGIEGLVLNTGHGTLGWTMACGSARVTADLIAGRAPATAIDDLTLERFG